MAGRDPAIICFLCNWCSYEGADSAGRSEMTYPANVKPSRVRCSGRVEPVLVAKAFAEGADGVLILGCHPGACHYREGNVNALKRVLLLRRLLDGLGVDQRRLRIDWISATEDERFVHTVTAMVDDLRQSVEAEEKQGVLR